MQNVEADPNRPNGRRWIRLFDPRCPASPSPDHGPASARPCRRPAAATLTPLGHPFTSRRMAVREIIKLPDPRLRVVSQPVRSIDDEVRALVADMLETMYAAPGIGLAAIQVGVPRRVLTIDVA